MPRGRKLVKKEGGDRFFGVEDTRLISEWIGPRQGLGIGGGVSSFPLGLINMSLSTLLGKNGIASFAHVLMACDFKG